MTASAPTLGLSALFVLVSVAAIPAWCNKRRETAPPWVLRVVPGLALAAALLATLWLTLGVESLGSHHTSADGQTHAVRVATVLGIPIMLIPLVILLAFIGVDEILSRFPTAEPTSAVSPSPSVAHAIPEPIEPAVQVPEPVWEVAPLPERVAEPVPVPVAEPMPEPMPVPEPERVPIAAAAVPVPIPAPALPRSRRPVRVVPSRVFASAGRRLDDLTHRDKRTIEAIRRQLAAGNVEFRTALADTTQQIELRLLPELEHRAQLQAGTESALEKVQDTLAACAADLERAMQGVSDLCATVVEQLEADRLERPVLTEAIEYLSELYSDDTEISIIEDDEPVRSEPVPFTYEPYATWGHRDDNGGGMLTSVKRLRQRAQRAGREVWIRAAKPRPSRTGHRSSP